MTCPVYIKLYINRLIRNVLGADYEKLCVERLNISGKIVKTMLMWF
jgi:hypothetical protein